MKSPEESTIAPTPGIQTRRGMMVMLVSVLAFTINTLLLKYIGSGDHRIGPDVSLFFRALVGTVVVLVFFRGSRPVRIAPVFRNRDLVLRGISGLLGTAAYYWTIPSLGAGKATLICNTYVVFASVFALFSLGEKLNLTRLLWLLAAFAGIALLVGPGDGGGGFTFGFYEVLALFGAVMAAWAVVLVRHLSLGFSIGTIYLAQCLWILGPVAILAVPDLASLSWNETGVLALAATAASFGQLAMNEGYRCLTVTTGASVQMLWPVATTVGGWLLFGERFGALQWLGASLILAAIFKITAGSAAVRRN
jgi:drug/metabolite transporter (DMT)-like permease